MNFLETHHSMKQGEVLSYISQSQAPNTAYGLYSRALVNRVSTISYPYPWKAHRGGIVLGLPGLGQFFFPFLAALLCFM